MGKKTTVGSLKGFLSANQLAERWGVSRSGAVAICERHGIRSAFLGGTRRGTRRFLLADVERYEQEVVER